MLKPYAIRNLRESLGHTQEEFGAFFDVTRGTVARWEAGDRVPERKYERIFEELQEKDLWPHPDFFVDALTAFRSHAGSAAFKRLKKQHAVSARALHNVAETLIEASGSHPGRYQEISQSMDRSRDLLESIFRKGLLRNTEYERLVDEFFKEYQPQEL